MRLVFRGKGIIERYLYSPLISFKQLVKVVDTPYQSDLLIVRRVLYPSADKQLAKLDVLVPELDGNDPVP